VSYQEKEWTPRHPGDGAAFLYPPTGDSDNEYYVKDRGSRFRFRSQATATGQAWQYAGAMTIAIGFWCKDGIVLASDTQTTDPAGGYKHDEPRFYEHRDPEWTTIFTYAGAPEVMRKFSATFMDSAFSASISSCKDITQIVGEVLSDMTCDLSFETGGALYILGALAIHDKEMLMIKTANGTVCTAGPYEQIGVGDSSLLRFLERMVCGPTGTEYATAQALKLSVYLVHQARKYIDGCGGATNIRVLRPDGHFDISDGVTGDSEKEIEEIESRLSIAASLSFDARVPARTLEQSWETVMDKLKKGHA